VTTTLSFTVGITIFLIIGTLAERMGDAPMPESMKIWMLSITVLSWLLATAVYDLRTRRTPPSD
jgi:hypothetical protein